MGAENLGNSLVAGYPQFVMSKFLSLGTVLVYVIFATTILTYFNSANVLVFLCTTIVHALSSDKKLRFYSFWNKLSESGRPRNILFSVACAAVFVGSVVTVTAHLFTACLFGLSCLMIVVMLSLLRVDDNPTFVSRFIAIIGIIVSCMLICYHWVRSGETICEKLITFSPIFVGMFVGVLLRLQGDDDTSIHRNPISIERQTIVKDLLTCSESENSD
jgi:hypothetical protein